MLYLHHHNRCKVYYFVPGMGAKYFFIKEYICLSVCLSAHITSKSTLPNPAHFCACCLCLWPMSYNTWELSRLLLSTIAFLCRILFHQYCVGFIVNFNVMDVKCYSVLINCISVYVDMNRDVWPQPIEQDFFILINSISQSTISASINVLCCLLCILIPFSSIYWRVIFHIL